MNKLQVKDLKAAKTDIAPSDGFVDRVMQKVEQPKQRHFDWLIAATAMGALAIALVVVPGFTSNDTVTAVENDIAEIESLLEDLERGFSDVELDDVEQ